MKWKCVTCGEEHDGLPLSYGSAPAWKFIVPEAEFESRVDANEDQCIIDGNHFFVRGSLEIPIIDTSQTFSWGVWFSLSEKSFRDMSSRWDAPSREGVEYFGWLVASLPGYPETMNLPCTVVSRQVGVIPLVLVQDESHPLAAQQRSGVSLQWVQNLAHELLH